MSECTSCDRCFSVLTSKNPPGWHTVKLDNGSPKDLCPSCFRAVEECMRTPPAAAKQPDRSAS